MKTDIRKLLQENATLPLWPEAARVLNLTRYSAYAAAAKGEIPTIRFGRLLRVPVPALRRLLDQTSA
jgi:excisionase family DNA binding protein